MVLAWLALVAVTCFPRACGSWCLTIGVLRIWAHVDPQRAGRAELNLPSQPPRLVATWDTHLCRSVALRHVVDPPRSVAVCLC